ncbi:MAG: hypothetical protein HY459_00035 [Parcubacteria group bacterium]|nr:hypothetical protein [Parcubacteria group bacterium]
MASPDPSLHNIAFNLTLAQFDLYTNKTAMLQPDPVMTPGSLRWFNSTVDGRQVNGTRFLFEIPTDQALSGQNITWTIGIAKGNYTGSASSPTFLRFKWNGTVTSGTSARYILLNGTSVEREVAHSANFTSGQSPSSLPCLSDEECFDVSRFIGKSLTLVFKFNSTLAGKGLKVEVSNIVVASVSPQFANPQTDIHTMNVDTSNQIIHNANSTIATYNTTALQPQNNLHTWNSTAVIFRFPESYTLTGINLNGTNPLDLSRTLDNGTCTPSCNSRLPIGNTTVSNTRFISFNATSVFDEIKTSMPAVIGALSPNVVDKVETALNGVVTNFWMPGDTVGVRMRSQPGFNVTASQTITFTAPNTLTPPINQTIMNKGGQYLYNFTLPATAALGRWNITGAFLSDYDYGLQIHEIRVEQLKATALTLTGAAGQGGTLTVQGSLAYVSNTTTSAGSVNVTTFAVDASSLPGPIFSTGTASSGLYISNITLTNGVFNQNQPLIIFFTVVNPTPSTAFSANLTIDHEWYGTPGGDHGATVTFPLTLGHEPFTLSPSSVYRMDVSLTPSGIQVTVKSVIFGITVTRTLDTGSSGVAPSRQHFGLFEISIKSKPLISGGSETAHSLRSPMYAYLVDSPLIPSRLLGFSPTVSTLSDGSFSTTINADKVLGAKRLVVFALARDISGVVLGKGQTMTAFDSTLLIPTADTPSEVTTKQSVTVTLNLKSNSTSLPITLTVNLDLSGSGTVATKTVAIQPGTTEPTTFTFAAPAAAGSYLLTFSSPQYGAPLLTKTLNVVLLQSSLQILIPAIIGLVAALVILGFYLIRSRPETEMKEERKQRSQPGKPSKPQQGSSSSKSLTRS